MGVCVWVCTHEFRCLWKPEECAGSLVTSGCLLPYMVLVTKLWDPAKAVSVGWRHQGNMVVNILDRFVRAFHPGV